MKKLTHHHTIRACFTGYVVQAIINNLLPLLFLTLQSSHSIPLSRITLLITINFGTQLFVDLISSSFVDRIGYRTSIVAAHVFSAVGLAMLSFLPDLMPDPYTGLVLSVAVYAVGGGLLEVLVSPIAEACPTDNKESVMSMLHSFYCWGHVAVVLLSTVFFAVFGITAWKLLVLIWVLVPLANSVVFTKVPIYPLVKSGERGLSLKELMTNGSFWLMMLMMICAGASEQAVSQWASTFAEAGLNVSKTVGDLAGPMLFAILMGSSRAFYGKLGDRLNLKSFMAVSAALCIASYLLVALSPVPILGLLGCGLCGLSVGIMWPGSFSIASASIKRGGTLLFALLALAGDVGCSVGPSIVGFVSGAFDGNLSVGILTAIVFPVLMLTCCLAQLKRSKQHNSLT